MYPVVPAVLAATSFGLYASSGNVSSWAAVLTGVASVIASTAVLIGQIKTRQEVGQIHIATKDVQYQVTTLNGKTLAVLADNVETRRIEALPEADKTEGDKDHVADVPPPD